MFEPKAIATGPLNHHVYVSDRENRRISEFTAWGEFVRSFGWGVRDGAAELQSCTAQTTCRKGLTGEGKGEFGEIPQKSEYAGPTGLAIDATGDLYALDLGNFRLQKFDSEGHFLLMIGGEVNKTKVKEREEEEANSEPVTVTEAQENLCTQASGDECGAGTLGTGPGELSIENVFGVDGNYVTIDRSSKVTSGGTVYVADKGRVQAFDTGGNVQFSFQLPEDLNPGALAFDPMGGNLYFAGPQSTYEERPTIYRLDAVTGKQTGLPIVPDLSPPPQKDRPLALAVDPVGKLYVIDKPYQIGGIRVLKYDPAGKLLAQFDGLEPSETGGGRETLESALATATVGKAAGEVNIYVAHNRLTAGSPGFSAVKVYGPTPDPAVVGPPPKVPPTIKDQYATTVGTREATLRAAINPHFWNDTTYFVEYGVGRCSEGGCTEDMPLPPGSQLTTKVVGGAFTTPGVFLTALQPGTTYHYRFIAQGSGSEGQPVLGEEATFTTRTPSPPPNGDCENQPFRGGPAALLPDCRAYEMVSPVDKNGADVSVVFNSQGFEAGLDQGAPSGESLSYSVYRAFGDSVGSPYASQYLATRDAAAGWSSHSISSAGGGGSVLISARLDREYRGFSAELSQGWLFTESGLPLDPNAPPGYANLYRRGSDGSYEAMVTVKPPATSPLEFVPELQGQGGQCTVFRANDKLTEDAAAGSKYQLYENCGGQLSLVSLTPAGAPATGVSAGTGGVDDRSGRLEGAVSADGSKIFWSNSLEGEGKLFVRIDGSETLALSKVEAQFLAAAADGSKAIYTEAGSANLFEFTIGVNKKEKGTLIADGFQGFLAASEDASRVYFLSTKALAEGAEEGKPNLYLYEASAEPGEPGSFTYIATLADADAVSGRDTLVGPARLAPIYHAAQATPDGGAVAFDSAAPLSGYDNLDARSGKPDTEVFVYRASTGTLTCVSCDPSGARPSGREVSPAGHGKLQPVAASIPTGRSSLYTPRALSADGSRLFFTSYVPLAQRDSNGQADVYQWEATGKGDCEEGSLGYDPAWEGCVNLISSGESTADAKLVDSSADGRDVFFKTYSSLLSQDPGLLDIYDARAGGGFPAPQANAAPCEGEACQSPPEPPNDPTPGSSSFDGAGNVSEPQKTRKRHHKRRKAKKHPHHHKRAHGKQGKTK